MRELEYDYLVVATGTQREWPVVPKSLCRTAYVDDASLHIDELEKAEHITVVGGGLSEPSYDCWVAR